MLESISIPCNVGHIHKDKNAHSFLTIYPELNVEEFTNLFRLVAMKMQDKYIHSNNFPNLQMRQEFFSQFINKCLNNGQLGTFGGITERGRIVVFQNGISITLSLLPVHV